MDEASDLPTADASFRVIRVFRGPKVLPEQARALMEHLALTFFGVSTPRRTCTVDSVGHTVTALLHFREKRKMPPSLAPGSSVNRADGNSEIEGKAAKGSGERVGKGASFKSAKPVRRRLSERGSAVQIFSAKISARL